MTTSQTPTVVEKVHLICIDSRSNTYKFYDIALLKYGDDLYQAVGYNGRIKGEPSDPQNGVARPQSPGPVSYRRARGHFDALERDKRREYEENPYKPRYYASATTQRTTSSRGTPTPTPAATTGTRASAATTRARPTTPAPPQKQEDDEKADRLDSLEF